MSRIASISFSTTMAKASIFMSSENYDQITLQADLIGDHGRFICSRK